MKNKIGADQLKNGVLELDDKLRAIKIWNRNFHPLTCNNDNCRGLLQGCIQYDKVVLKCKCGYIQDNVPNVVYEYYKRTI